MAKLKATYAIDGDFCPRLAMIPATATVGDFLELIKSKQKNASLAHVYLDGRAVDLSDLFEDYFAPDAVFSCSPNPLPPSTDFMGFPSYRSL